MSYCCIVWGSASATALYHLNLLHKRALRLVTHSDYLSHTNPLFIRLSLLKINDINRLQIAMFIFKVRYNLLPTACLQFCPTVQIRSRLTRNNDYFNISHSRTITRDNAISVSGPRLWSSLPAEVQTCTSISIFKRKVSALFRSHYY